MWEHYGAEPESRQKIIHLDQSRLIRTEGLGRNWACRGSSSVRGIRVRLTLPVTPGHSTKLLSANKSSQLISLISMEDSEFCVISKRGTCNI